MTGRKLAPFRQPIKRGGPKLPPEAINQWWNPGRPGVAGGPPSFTKRLAEVDETLAVTWNAYANKWLIWMKKPALRHPICTGWSLLFAVDPKMGLDNRIFHRLYEASGRKWGNGKEYFRAVQGAMEHDTAKKVAKEQSDAIDHAMETFNHSQISISMCGKSNGSKFSTYHQ